MAGRVIEECVEKDSGDDLGGGFITKRFENLLYSITTPGNRFFEDPRSYFLPPVPPI